MTKKKIIGSWVLEPDQKSEKKYGKTILTFGDDDKLTYTIFTDDQKKQTILLKYWLEGDTLFTDQPSSPKIEETKILFVDKNTISLNYKGTESIYQKILSS